MNPFIASFYHSDRLGKLIFLVLYALSVISWAVLIYKLILFKKSKKLSFQFASSIDKNKHQLLNYSFNAENLEINSFANIFNTLKETSIESLNKNQFFLKKDEIEQQNNFLSEADLQLIEAQMSAKISKEIQFFEKNLFILSTIVTLAPFLGLLGTVWGILKTFSAMSMQTVGNTNLLSGLSMALGTTVVGLIVAIPALVAYNFLKNNLYRYLKEMESFSQKLLATLEMQYRRVKN
jgi:biopolymer transport protein TolQ